MGKIRAEFPQQTLPRHLLWSLYFLKGYGAEERNFVIIGVPEKRTELWYGGCKENFLLKIGMYSGSHRDLTMFCQAMKNYLQ